MQKNILHLQMLTNPLSIYLYWLRTPIMDANAFECAQDMSLAILKTKDCEASETLSG